LNILFIGNKKRSPFALFKKWSTPKSKNFTQIDDRLYIKYGYKKSPTYIEQINRLPCEVGYYHFLNAAKICTIFETTKLFSKIFSSNAQNYKKAAHIPMQTAQQTI
jgi:hypothetical protein